MDDLCRKLATKCPDISIKKPQRQTNKRNPPKNKTQTTVVHYIGGGVGGGGSGAGCKNLL